MNANFTYILGKFVVFFEILKNFTKYCIFFENTQNLSFAMWVSNERKFYLNFGNINCVFQEYSKTLQNTVTFSKILKIFSFAIWVSNERKLRIHFRNIYCVFRNTQKFHKMYLFRKYSKF